MVKELENLEFLNLFDKSKLYYILVIFSNLQIPLFLINRDHKIVFQNEFACKVFNSRIGGLCWNEFWKGETLSKKDKELFEKGVLKSSMECTFCRALEALDEQKIITEEVFLADKWWEAWWVPVSKDVFLHYFIDITKIVKSRDKYKDSQNFIRRISDLIVDPIWAKDKNLKFTFANKATAKVLLGIDNPDDAIGRTLDYFARGIMKNHPEENYYTIYEECKETDRKVIETKKPERFEVCGYIKGEKVYFDVIKVPWLDKKDNLLGIIGVVRDITKRKEIERQLYETQQELKKSLEYHKAIFQDNSILILVANEERKIVDINNTLLRALGYRKEEIVGKSTRVIYFDDEHYNNFLSSYENAVEKGNSTVFEYYFRRKDGSVLWTEVSRSIVEMPDGSKIIIWSGIDTTRIHDLKERLRYQAIHDSLTGLYNRYMLEEEVKRAIERAKRNRTMLAVCFIDLDDFKPINDTYGHDTGDRVLKTIANRLESSLRSTDFVARFGGDEFVVLLEGIKNEKCLESIVDKIGNVVKKPIKINDNRVVKVGLSMGICLYPKLSIDNPERLIRNSDIAMYEAKRNKLNRDKFYKFYSETASK